MKKNKGHITLSILLLALMLVSRVGLHLFHQHDAVVHHSTSVSEKAISGSVLLSAHASEAADCALCKLDAFQELSIADTILFLFFLAVAVATYRFLLTAFSEFLIFTNNRGPPALIFSVA